jgi:hypothetical protein
LPAGEAVAGVGLMPAWGGGVLLMLVEFEAMLESSAA